MSLNMLFLLSYRTVAHDFFLNIPVFPGYIYRGADSCNYTGYTIIMIAIYDFEEL